MDVISTIKAPKAIGPYSQGMSSNGFVFTSGQIPFIPETGKVAGDTIDVHAKQSMENVKAVLEAAGTSMDKVIKTTCFLADMKYFAQFNEVYSLYFVGNPARSCVAVKELPQGVLCEVEAIAER